MLDLNYKNKKHRKMFVKILTIVDPENNKFVLKERIMTFFEVSGFNIIQKLCQEQMEIDRENETLEDNLNGGLAPSIFH